jgi:N-acetylglucosaminyl-diphospho-decaprenol L-rhamnosyltransferase
VGTSAVGVVMATRDRADEVLTTLGRLDALPERPPVAVVDNASSDETAARVAERWPDVVVERLPANLGAAARSVGAALLDTPLVAFSDDDSWWAPGALARAARRFDEDDGLGLLAATVLVGPEERPDPVTAAMAGSPLAAVARGAGVPVLGFLACGAVVRRHAFLAVGGFEPRYGVGGEEELLALDLLGAGWRVEHHPDVVAHHFPSTGARDPEARRRRQVRNALLTAVLRHHWADAGRRAAARARTTPPRTFLGGLRQLPGHVGWALSCRDPVPAHVQASARLLAG